MAPAKPIPARTQTRIGVKQHNAITIVPTMPVESNLSANFKSPNTGFVWF